MAESGGWEGRRAECLASLARLPESLDSVQVGMRAASATAALPHAGRLCGGTGAMLGARAGRARGAERAGRDRPRPRARRRPWRRSSR